MVITERQYRWLDSRGDRNENDVGENEEGLFVYMADGYGGDVKVYLPVDKSVDFVRRSSDNLEE